LNWPGVLLTEQEKQLRNPLPRMVRHVRYAPLAELLPPAAAIVHHGGIGTAARALKAGIPQLVRPTGFDQYNNASHLARLGVAKSIARREFTPDNVATRLRELLESQTVRERCCHYATKFEHSTALESTCDYIEALM
jgi:UDP:flavonoid glycosyltransferase YjiC (YdhE family)